MPGGSLINDRAGGDDHISDLYIRGNGTRPSEKENLLILLDQSPCVKPLPLRFDEERILILLFQLDMNYFYEVDKLTGEVVLLKKFEKDYLIKNDLSPLLKKFKEVVVHYDDKEYSREEVLEGIPLDWFPQKLILELILIPEDGEPLSFDLTVLRNQLPDY